MKVITCKIGYATVSLFLLIILFVSGCKKDNSTNNVDKSGPSPGQITIAPFQFMDDNSGHIMIMDSIGNVIIDKKTHTLALDFRKWIINNTTYYSYFEHDPDAYHIPGAGYIPSTLKITDQNLNEIDSLRLLPYNGRTEDDPDALDAHDFILLDSDHYIALAYYEKVVDNIPEELNPSADHRVVAPIIQEVQSGVVIFEWDGTIYPEFYTSSTVNNDFSNPDIINDYMHINSIYIDPGDNNLICSFRNMDQVVKIDRSSGAIIWRLGGEKSDFPITDEMQPLHQHHATLTSYHTLTMFDNGEAEKRPYTRILEFDLDENAMEINNFKSMDLPDGMFADIMGSVQRIGNNYFIGCGSLPKILEINSLTGEIVLNIDLEEVSYRAFKMQ